MAMIQPVVPSNAPPLQQDSAHSSRVLQEHSGNRQQQHDYSYQHQHSHEQKYSASLPTENVHHAYPGSQQGYRPAHVYHQTPSQRHDYRYGHGHHGPARTDPYSAQLDDIRHEKEASFLRERFRSSDQYMKYRTRQPKDDKGSHDQKWPESLESAFFKALVKWPPMGRRQLPLKGELRGRNQLISASIKEWTGETRTRKQVMSHIQVLKPYVKHDPYIMKYFVKHELGTSHRHRNHTDANGAYYATSRRPSNYPLVAPPQNAHTTVPSMSTSDHETFSKFKDRMEVFEPTDFSMFVQRKDGEDSVSRLHTYTKALARPRQLDHQAQDWATFGRQYPLLDAMKSSRIPLDCNILIAEASIAFPTDTWKKDKDKVELGISFLCSSRHLPPYAKVYCQNSFYRDGHYLQEYRSIDPVPMTQSEQDDGIIETQVKFGSAFWAKTLASLAGRLRDGSEESAQEVDAHLKGITASQEILIKTLEGHERLLVIYWKFRHSTAPCGRAYWSRLRLPVSPSSNAGTSTGYESEPKNDRVDSVYDYTLQSFSGDSYQATQPTALQSPFEYDNGSSSTGSALGSATWPRKIDDSTNTAPQSAVDPFPPDNSFDFPGGNINIACDPNLDFSNFDSTAFDFSATADFATDPSLQDYGAGEGPQDYSQQSYEWCANFSTFDLGQSQQTQQPLSAEASVSHSPVQYDSSMTYSYDLPVTSGAEPGQTDLTASQSWDHFNPPSQYDQTHDGAAQYDAPPDGHYDQAQAYQQTVGRRESQAYGGAGQEVVATVKKEEHDPLAALADASTYMDQGRGGSMGHDESHNAYHPTQ